MYIIYVYLRSLQPAVHKNCKEILSPLVEGCKSLGKENYCKPLIDIFPTNAKQPYRIDFFDDIIVSYLSLAQVYQ